MLRTPKNNQEQQYQISSPQQQQDFQSVYSDEQEPMTNRDLERLSNLWKKMKNNKNNLNLSEQSAALKNQMNLSSERSGFKSQYNTSKNNNIINNNNISNDISSSAFDGGRVPGSIVQRRKSTNRSQNNNNNNVQLDYSSSNNNNNIDLNSVQISQNNQNSQQQQQFQLDNFQLQQMQSNNLNQQKFMEAQQELDQCHEKISELLKLSNQQQQEIQVLQSELNIQNNLNQNSKDIVQKQEMNSNYLNQELQNKDQQILELQTTFQQIQDNIKQQQKDNQLLIDENEQLKQQIMNKGIENDRIRQKLIDVEKAVDEIYIEKKSKGTALLEVEYLKSDVERLLTLLKTTKEFKDFSNFAQDSKGIRYLNKMPNLIGLNKFKNAKKHHCTTKGVNFEIIEKLLWVPMDAYQFIQNLKSKYNSKFSETCVEELLLGLNHIWLERENNQKNREKQRFENEIASLKKMINKHVGYTEMTSKRQISRLKQQLSKLTQEKDLMKKQGTNNNNNGVNSKDMVYFTDAIQIAQEFEEQIQNKDQIIEILQQKVVEQSNSGYDKMIYLDGAIWMADKQIFEIERHKESVQGYILQFNREFEQLLENQQFSDENVFKMYQQFVESIDKTQDELIQKVCIMREQTFQNVHKLSEQQNLQQQQQFNNNIIN